MKNIVIILIPLIFYACGRATDTQSDLDKLEDSFARSQRVDSMVKNTLKDAYFKDTLNAANSPVKIISARPVTQEYSSDKNIELIYENVSGKNNFGNKVRLVWVRRFWRPREHRTII